MADLRADITIGQRGPVGPAGPQGLQGPQGPQGPQGANGDGTNSEMSVIIEGTGVNYDLYPNIYYKITTTENMKAFLNFNLIDGETGVCNEYQGEIQYTGSTFHYLKRSPGITWVFNNVEENTNAYFKIEPNKKYLFSIINEVGILVGVDL